MKLDSRVHGFVRMVRWRFRYLTAIGSFRLLFGVVLLSQLSFPGEPRVRIGIERSVSDFKVSSDSAFRIEGLSAYSAAFSTVVTIGDREGPFTKDDLETQIAIETDDGRLLVRDMEARIRIAPEGAPLRVNDQSYRGTLEVRGTSEAKLTLINELPLEEYLLGVVPNELSPDTFPELEALKAQAIAARTYIVRNLGQFDEEGFDICDTDLCQVYRGLDTEHALATQAVAETRGQIATYDGEPINALYSSTCGGQTEDAENVFGEAVPYLVSTICHYEHPAPQPFKTTASYASWQQGLLSIAEVDDFTTAARFLGIDDMALSAPEEPEELPGFIKRHFFPDIPAENDIEFLQEQGILLVDGENPTQEILLRLLLRKNAFEWQDARLIRWDGEALRVRVGAEIRELALAPDVAIFRRIGDQRIPVDQGVWIGGESMQLRIVGDEVEALTYQSSPSRVSADRYSPLAKWQTHRTEEELNVAVRPLDIGDLRDIAILERGASNRVVRVEVQGTRGSRAIGGPRLRTLLGLRDSIVYIDEERNRDGQLLGMTFFGRGWGHGVGLCQVGAYGMAIDGASASEILKTYYRGIELETVY